MKKSIKILFLGDSITDSNRDKRNYHNLGNGYAYYSAQALKEAYPDIEFEFINMGINGNRSDQIFDRLSRDVIDFKPDIISVLCGINDIWHRYGSERIMTSDEQFELNYRSILKRIRKETDAKLLIMAPYILDCVGKDNMREDLKTLLPIVRRLADEYADAFVPLDEHFNKAMETMPEPRYYSPDGVHPNENGARLIAQHYTEAIKPLVNMF